MSLARPVCPIRAARRTAVHGALALALGAVLTLPGCSGALVNGYFLLPTAPEAYVYDDFESRDDGRWFYGAETGYDNDHDVVAGHFIARQPRQFALTSERFPGHVEVRLEWEIWSPDAIPVRDNGDSFDFRIVLDGSDSDGSKPVGVWVAFKIPDPGGDDVLTIADDTTGDAAYAQTTSSTPTSGTLQATFNRMANPPTIDAEVFDIAGSSLLQTSLELPGGWSDDVHVMVQASGYVNPLPDFEEEHRVLDSVLVIDPESL